MTSPWYNLLPWCHRSTRHLRSHSGSTHPQCHIVNPILAYFVYFFQSPLCLLPSAVAHIHHRPCEAFPHPAPLSACCKPVGWGSNGNSQKSRCPPIKMFPNCCGTGGAAALPILALTDNVPSVLHGVINECGKSGRFRKISVVGKAVFLQNFKVDVM